ncbi:uncharacterized protein LOC113098681 [Carassius auratus]|uniref:Uncharacterized protein LOC113098681 n=1 Tax=Carassius auratus TaxID=7957 RepID=A0A6P6PFR7_CARAU|nr:uncharacterized protein LOC113098681 [Carassius auratus]
MLQIAMEEQLKVLTELVQQLQTDNQQLRQELVRRPVEVVDEAQSASSRLDVGARPSVNISASERYVYVPRERKCPRFSGRRSVDLLTAEDWVEEVRRSLIVRPVPVAEKALFVYDLLDGEAKAEVKFHPSSDRDDPEKIFIILLEMYGCSQSLVGLQKQFFQRRQLEGESLREYSHALMALMEAMKRKNLTGICNPDHTLRDQFIEHMRDNTLRRELKRQVRLNAEMSFLEVRAEAIRWADEGGTPSIRPRAHSCTADVQVVGTYRSTQFSSESTNELGELKDCLRKQQTQLDAILKHLSINPSNPVGGAVGSRPVSARFQADGKPICMRCNKAGHIARFCRSDLAGMHVNVREGVGIGPGPSSHGQGRTVVRETPEQPEN